jgi:hypothetical protein
VVKEDHECKTMALKVQFISGKGGVYTVEIRPSYGSVVRE